MLTVTPVPGTNQCAEMERIALGLGVSTPRLLQRAVYAFSASAFIGLPCPKNMAGSMQFYEASPKVYQVSRLKEVADEPAAAVVKTSGRVIKHARYYWWLLAESGLTRQLFGAMLRRIAALPVTG